MTAVVRMINDEINLHRITMIAVSRHKLPLNTLWKVAGLVIALQWPVLVDLNHDHDHDGLPIRTIGLLLVFTHRNVIRR